MGSGEAADRRRQRVLELTLAMHGELELDPLLDVLIRGAIQLADCEGGLVAVREGDRFEVRRYANRDGAVAVPGQWEVGELSGLGSLFGEPRSTEADGAIPDLIARQLHARPSLALPIPDPDGGASTGFLILQDGRRRGGFSAADRALLKELARSAGSALRNARRFARVSDEERTRAERRQRHSQRLQTVGRIAGSVAHDFNNLLTVVLGETDLLLQDPDERPPHRQLEEIRDAAVRARFLTRRLLAFSRRESPGAEAVDPSTAVQDMGRLLRRVLGPDVEVREELAAGLREVSLRRGELDQVLMNLAVNARDAMPAGGLLTLRTAPLRRAHDRARLGGLPGVVIEVADTGQGMSDEVRERIFDPFFTTKEEDRGTGLGLSTVADIVREAGGTIEVRSILGEGSVFAIYLPYTQGGSREERAPEPHHEPACTDATVLLVEDDPAVRRLIGRVLSRRGVRVLEAENGERALELAEMRGRSVDLLLIDVMLPDMGGLQLWHLLRRRLARHRTIFMSGYLREELGDSGLADQEVEFLPKPFAIRELVDIVDRTLGRR